jgi:hypothetical protein
MSEYAREGVVRVISLARMIYLLFHRLRLPNVRSRRYQVPQGYLLVPASGRYLLPAGTIEATH